ncbi:ALF repeat-containing protein [Kitasatospora sp. A2-31]|uniref:ALF repeat-containing protein n=1 Tax=Kitasatospora sp. A2-31 TaxID=2916414 RepID=UPI001EEBC565|nr:ALF repeat-containing protein [Kitasatospora sp. A2-31]MCG6498220.1 ALF repeat-containing protein [Kitasatospora sp. A2-31]
MAAVAVWMSGGPAVRRAAELALTSSDADVHAFVAGGRAAAADQDLRAKVEEVVAVSGPGVREVTAGKVIDGLALPDHEPAPAETATVYQRIVTAFNDHPGQVFRVRDLHELLGLPTDEPSINVTRSRLGRLVRQGLLAHPGRGRYQKPT